MNTTTARDVVSPSGEPQAAGPRAPRIVTGAVADMAVPASARVPARIELLRRLLAFTSGSAVGLVVDLGGFWLGVEAGLAPGVANVVSSLTSIVVVYLLVTRRAFGATPGIGTFVVFLAWYALNIGVTSTLIELGSTATGLPPLLLKACSVPLSFAANFAFNLVLHRAAAVISTRRATS